jgi:hypothetical protein
MLEKILFGMKVKTHINRFLKFVIFYGLGILLIEIIRYVVIKAAAPSEISALDWSAILSGKQLFQNERLQKLLSFIKTAKPLYLLLISFLLSRKLYASFNEFKGNIYGQGLVCGVAGGIAIGIVLSVLNFVLSLSQGNILDAVIDLISFLWTSWEYVLLNAVFILAIIGIMWFKDNYVEIKKKVKQEDVSEKEMEDNKK